eukprot:TRINITY_DN24098_c0_g1_i1.p1 TRINITY_DN24098_c0_g1~~TRINITY_DN24098_c0_g1_i1.p1  ORF type:complete len:418 (-),score=41.55 TRINITY_DN24098_c0_g1_i1:77-1267(-)
MAWRSQRSSSFVELLCYAYLFFPSSQAIPIPGGFGATFGNGLAGVNICKESHAPQVVVNQTLATDGSETHGVLHHFWCTSCGQQDNMWVDYFVDGETSPSISFQPSMMCGVAFPTHLLGDKRFSAGGMCGKSARVGGWWNTFPVPFYKSIIVTVRADASQTAECFPGYVNIRGTINLPVVLPGSGLPLPMPGTRLFLQKNAMAERKPLEYVTVAHLNAGQRGMVFQTTWAVESQNVGGAAAGGGYIEGCWQLYRQASEPFPGLIVGTGVEDYFDSGYYFGADSGEGATLDKTLFASDLSGLTIFERNNDGTERLSAYRFHASDPLVMTDGGKLVWRVGAAGLPGTTKCGNKMPKLRSLGNDADAMVGRQLTAVNVSTYAWVYLFPSQGEHQGTLVV